MHSNPPCINIDVRIELTLIYYERVYQGDSSLLILFIKHPTSTENLKKKKIFKNIYRISMSETMRLFLSIELE